MAAVVLAVVRDGDQAPRGSGTLAVTSDAARARALSLLQGITDTFLPAAYREGDRSYVETRIVQFAHLLGFWDPELALALSDMGVSAVMFAQSWMTTLFSHSVAIPVAASLWDVMLGCDDRFTLFMAVALVIQVT